MSNKIKVVIIGVGMAGSTIQRNCMKHRDLFDVTMISPTSFTEVSPNLIPHILKKKDDDFLTSYKRVVQLNTPDRAKDTGSHIKQMVTGISEDKVVTLADGKQIKGDYIVCASGLKLDEFWRPSSKVTTSDERIQQLLEFRHNVAKAKSLLIVGGGVIGVEMAAEMLNFHPGTELHIVQGAGKLLALQNPKTSKSAYEYLTSKKCNVYFNSYAVEQDGGYVLKPSSKDAMVTSQTWQSAQTSTLNVLKPDVVLKCIGGRPATDYLPAQFKNKAGEAIVDDTLQVVGMPGVFAIGDMNNFKGAKTGMSAGFQAATCFQNIIELHKNKGKQLKKYKSPGNFAFISLGQNKAILDSDSFAFPGLDGKGSTLLRSMRKGIEKLIHDSV